MGMHTWEQERQRERKRERECGFRTKDLPMKQKLWGLVSPCISEKMNGKGFFGPNTS